MIRITISKPTFKCAENANNTYSRFTVNETTLLNGNKTNGDLKYPIGLLTADEVAYAGAYRYDETNKTFYLYNSSITFYWWLFAPDYLDGPYINYNNLRANDWIVSGSNGCFNSSFVGNSLTFRPSINLKASVLINGGDGTKENPYTLKLQ